MAIFLHLPLRIGEERQRKRREEKVNNFISQWPGDKIDCLALVVSSYHTHTHTHTHTHAGRRKHTPNTQIITISHPRSLSYTDFFRSVSASHVQQPSNNLLKLYDCEGWWEDLWGRNTWEEREGEKILEETTGQPQRRCCLLFILVSSLIFLHIGRMKMISFRCLFLCGFLVLRGYLCMCVSSVWSSIWTQSFCLRLTLTSQCGIFCFSFHT